MASTGVATRNCQTNDDEYATATNRWERKMARQILNSVMWKKTNDVRFAFVLTFFYRAILR